MYEGEVTVSVWAGLLRESLHDQVAFLERSGESKGGHAEDPVGKKNIPREKACD